MSHGRGKREKAGKEKGGFGKTVDYYAEGRKGRYACKASLTTLSLSPTSAATFSPGKKEPFFPSSFHFLLRPFRVSSSLSVGAKRGALESPRVRGEKKENEGTRLKEGRREGGN